jgi:hypothetical protein
MPIRPLTFRIVPRLRVSSGRAVGFLEGDEQLDAGPRFDELEQKQEWLVRSRMELWVDGHNGPDEYFHGYPNNPRYDRCFAFKWKEKRVGQRFYGFLCNPQPITNRGFRLCVLTIYAPKTEFETDSAELDRVNQWRANWRSKEAIRILYPEFEREDQKWKN